MKILQMGIRFPPAPGGAENHVYSISKELKARGHDVTVFTSNLYTEVPFKTRDDWTPEVDGIPVKRFPARTLGGDMHYVLMKGMVKAAMKFDCDIIHAHSYGYYQTHAAALAAKMSDKPFVITPHYHPEWSMWGGDKRKKLRWLYDRLAAGQVLNGADKIIGVSSHEMELLGRLKFNKKKVTVIPNGIEFERFTPIPDGSVFREKYGIDGTMILYAGRLASNKGLTYLLDAFNRILPGVPGAKLVLVGQDEGLRADLEKQAEALGVAEKVIFTGHLKDDGLFRAAYAACDIFALPSEYEAFGIVLLEAMACEKPCVGTRVGGVPEVIEEGKTGLIVEYADSKALGDALLKILSDAQLKKEMGVRGRTRVEDNFTWKHVVDEIEKVYGEITGHSGT